jgi:hypothetical protein
MLIDGKIYVPIEGPGGKMSGAMAPFPEEDPSYPALLAALQSRKEAYAIYYSADGTPIHRVNFK